jgi:uncharacterized membrane protein YccF (DUF307 family)
MAAIRIVLNVVWLVLAGVWMAIGYVIAGVICCVLIVTIPWGIASFRIALFALWPFGQRLERRPDAGLGSTLGNVIWFVVAGWWLAIGHVVTAIALAATMVGIPFAWANLKLIPVSLTPLGRRIVDVDQQGPLGSFGVAPRTPPPVQAAPAVPAAPAGRPELPWYSR